MKTLNGIKIMIGAICLLFVAFVISETKNAKNKISSEEELHLTDTASVNKYPGESKLQGLAFKKMIELAENLYEWIYIYKKSPYGSDIEKLASEKIINLVKTVEDCIRVSGIFPNASDEESILITKIIEIVGTKEQWKMLYLFSEKESKIQKLASEKMNE